MCRASVCKNIFVTAVGDYKGLQAGDPRFVDIDGSGRIDDGEKTADNRGDMVIIGNRFESQFFSIEIGASCIILCTNAEPNETIIERAKNKGCIILSSPYDSKTD